jgi:hypothetical protein
MVLTPGMMEFEKDVSIHNGYATNGRCFCRAAPPSPSPTTTITTLPLSLANSADDQPREASDPTEGRPSLPGARPCSALATTSSGFSIFRPKVRPLLLPYESKRFARGDYSIITESNKKTATLKNGSPPMKPNCAKACRDALAWPM